MHFHFRDYSRTDRHSGEERPGETPDLVVAEPGLCIQCSFLEIFTWDEAEGGVGAGGSCGGERRGASTSATHLPTL